METWKTQQHALDYRAGVIAAAAVEPYRDRDKHSQPFTPWDFFPSLPEPPRPKSDPEWNKHVLDGFFRGVDHMVKRGTLDPAKPTKKLQAVKKKG